jgi:hypothetical protein
MHQPFANEFHPEIQFCHSPDLTGFQRLQANAACRLYFPHD